MPQGRLEEASFADFAPMRERSAAVHHLGASALRAAGAMKALT